MSKKSIEKKTAFGIGGRLDLEHYHKIRADLLNWRIDPFIRAMEERKEEGRILAFVRGLHFSAQLIYAIRDLVSETTLEVDWGHLVDESENYCSRECDIIIHKRGHKGRWNGGIMDFKFIKKEKAVAVISCKSYLTPSKVDKSYVSSITPYVQRVWLFAECCESKYTESVIRQAKLAGYKNFWYMYKWSRTTTEQEWNENGWRDFAKKLRGLKD
jgi:hypothetical protein